MTRIALMLCSSLALAACGQPDIVVSAPPPPAEWLVCAPEPDRPSLFPLAPLTLPNGAEAYDKGQTDARDSAIARYILDLRAAHFDCRNRLGQVRDFYAAQE